MAVELDSIVVMTQEALDSVAALTVATELDAIAVILSDTTGIPNVWDDGAIWVDSNIWEDTP